MTPELLQLVAQSTLLGIPLLLLILSELVQRGAFPARPVRVLSALAGGVFAMAMGIYLSGLGLSMGQRLPAILLTVGVFSWANAASLRVKAVQA
ncbi:hypothetical protein [Deinococcus kurensis]|uniref:hypothetical protein n=1 Tax=Deinococcus kurensis TaxID=2662757 RepID=UPI0012D34451|nr:hypothetical protein [Deinococcus kurensis]